MSHSLWLIDFERWKIDIINVALKVVIDRLWVDFSRRRNGIASELVNTLINIENVDKVDICMTDPTPDGAKFGVSYFGENELLVAQ